MPSRKKARKIKNPSAKSSTSRLPSDQPKYFDSWVGTIVDNKIYNDDIIAWTSRNGGWNPDTQTYRNPIGAPGGMTSTSAEWEFSDDVIIGNFLFTDPSRNYNGYSRVAFYGQYEYDQKGHLTSAILDKRAYIVQAQEPTILSDFSSPKRNVIDYGLEDIGDHKVTGSDLNHIFSSSTASGPFFPLSGSGTVSTDFVNWYELRTNRLIDPPMTSLNPIRGYTVDQFLDNVPNGRRFFEVVANWGSSLTGDVV